MRLGKVNRKTYVTNESVTMVLFLNATYSHLCLNLQGAPNTPPKTFPLSQTQTILPVHKWCSRVWKRLINFYQILREKNGVLFRVRDEGLGNSSRLSKTQTLLLAHLCYNRVWNRWIRFLPNSEKIIFFLELETYEVGVNQDLVENRHQYQLNSGTLKFESLSRMTRIPFRVWDIWGGINQD